MVSSASNGKATLRLALAVLLTSLFAIFLSLTLGSGLAFAADNGVSAADTDSTTAITDPQQSPSEPAQDNQTSTMLSASASDAAAPQNTQDGPTEATSSTSLSASDAPFDTGSPYDNGTASFFIGIEPESLPYYSSIDPDLGFDPSYGGQACFYHDSDNTVYVFIEGEMGKAISLIPKLDYVRNGNQFFSNSPAELPSSDNTYYLMINWYGGRSPLPQGVYTSSPAQGSNSISSSGTSYDISALAFIDEYANLFSVENRIAHDGFQLDSGGSTTYLDLPHLFTMTRNGYELDPFFYGDTTLYAQATLVQSTSRAAQDASGTGITNVTYKVVTSNMIAFHISVPEKDTATMQVNVVDKATGKPVEIKWFTNDTPGFSYSFSASYENMLGEEMGGAYWPWTSNESGSLVLSNVLPSTYSLYLSHSAGEYKTLDINITVSEEEYRTSVQNNTRIIKTVELESLAPTQFTVSFVDESGNDLIAPKKYNSGTYGSQVTKPENEPVKAEDANYVYEFDHWETADGKKYPYTVISDMVFKPVFRSIHKNVTATATVHASGGLFDEETPAGVHYGLEEKTPSAQEQQSLRQTYTKELGNNDIVGVFEINLKRYNESTGEVEDLSEGVGHLSLSFNVPGVSDGTKLRILQLHKNVRTGLYELITHEGVVAGGKVSITLDGKLSTFIITTADDDPTSGQSDNPSGTESQSTDPTGNPQQTDEPVNNPSSDGPATNESTENESPKASETPADRASKVSNAIETAGEIATLSDSSGNATKESLPMVRTGSDGDTNDDKPAETGDEANMHLLVLMALASLGTACAFRRRPHE